ncbi:MAG: hypothetical protein K0R23_694 [Lacrimispora sp.]|jgi:hypothetical protein|nr:hypothetical protein [Lacrimispora sp.]
MMSQGFLFVRFRRKANEIRGFNGNTQSIDKSGDRFKYTEKSIKIFSRADTINKEQR